MSDDTTPAPPALDGPIAVREPWLSPDRQTLAAAYAAGRLTPVEAVDLVHDRIDARGVNHVWILCTHAQVATEPAELDTRLGRYTNFANLLDLCAVSVPADFRNDGRRFGISLLAPAWRDEALCALGERYHLALGGSPTELARLGPGSETRRPAVRADAARADR